MSVEQAFRKGSAGSGHNQGLSCGSVREVWSCPTGDGQSISLYIRGLLQAFLTARWPQGNWMIEDLRVLISHLQEWVFQPRRQDSMSPFMTQPWKASRVASAYVVLVASESQSALDAGRGEFSPPAWWGSNRVLGNTWKWEIWLWSSLRNAIGFCLCFYCKDFRAQDV